MGRVERKKREAERKRIRRAEEHLGGRGLIWEAGRLRMDLYQARRRGRRRGPKKSRRDWMLENMSVFRSAPRGGLIRTSPTRPS